MSAKGAHTAASLVHDLHGGPAPRKNDPVFEPFQKESFLGRLKILKRTYVNKLATVRNADFTDLHQTCMNVRSGAAFQKRSFWDRLKTLKLPLVAGCMDVRLADLAGTRLAMLKGGTR